jgi:hypothetical protein
MERARSAAAFGTVQALLGDAFDPQVFERAYALFSQPVFRNFIGDSRDSLIYLCLMVSAGVYEAGTLAERIRSGQLFRFDQFLRGVDSRRGALSAPVREAHDDFVSRFRGGDPAPFKALRVREYQETAKRMGQMEAESPVDAVLAQEIVITQEVRERASGWHFRGSLLFGVSDRPDEACLPPADLVPQGWQPLHRTGTDAVGE